MPTTHSGSENPTDDAPGTWRETKPNFWVREDRAIVRIRGVFPTRSAAEANAGVRSDGATQFEVLFHEEQLPSPAEEIAVVGYESDAREEALDAMATRQ